MELFIACIENDINKLNKLLETTNVYLSDNNGNTIGHLCAMYERYDILRKILTTYPQLVTYLNNEGQSLIHLINNNDVLSDMIDLLIDNNLTDELNVVPYDGTTIVSCPFLMIIGINGPIERFRAQEYNNHII